MKQHFATLTALCLYMAMMAQPAGYELPASHFQSLPLIELATFDHAALLAEDTEIENRGGRTNNGRMIDIPLNESHGVWTTMPDGSRLWQLRIRSEGARGLAVYFSGYHVPVGASLWLYNADRTMYDGPYNHTDNNNHGHMCAGYVTGDEAIVEYHEPYGVVGTPGLDIRGIAHFYRYVYNYNDEQRGGGSQACQVDVNCPPGDQWQPEKDAVVRLQIVDGQFLGLCSGSLVNNTAMDCRNYILTALHCALGVSDNDLLDLQVKFNYERSGCGSGAATSTHNKVGVFHRANSEDDGGEEGSDFLLIEMEDEIPASWNPFYAGWDASGWVSPSGVGIHHPAGDVKKISTYEDNLVSVWYGAPGSHWEVEWVETSWIEITGDDTTEVELWGVTEGGSSGSPLFTPMRHITGHLTGGLSFCDDPNEPDYYGKVAKDWDSNPNPPELELEPWLDPTGSGQEWFFGSYRNEGVANPCGISVSAEAMEQFTDVQVYPTASAGQVRIDCAQWNAMQEVKLYGTDGVLVKTFSLTAPISILDISELANGFYFITFIHESAGSTTRKISKL